MNSKDFFASGQFDPKKLDRSFYQDAQAHDFYVRTESKKTFSMVLPPPNVTGILHIGHALNISISDAIARFYHLRGWKVDWIPGTDHAGIATQVKFEKLLAEQNKSSSDFGSRQDFFQAIYSWAKQQQSTIISQAQNLVPLLNWNKAFFTLDQKVNEMVNKIFVDLYNQKLIYRKNRLVNWDVKLKTAISDIEVIHKSQKSKLYYIYYRVSETTQDLVVATTRPETMFGDVCLFVNPLDVRYQKFIGCKVINPANGQLIPVLADKYVDYTFATGVMKCTPAHDPNDYKLAKKHRLAMVNVMNPDGTMNELALEFANKDRFVARSELIELLKTKGSLQKIETIENAVGYSSRSDSQIEPLLSLQWFIKVKSLVKQIKALQKKSASAVKLVPPRFNKILERWFDEMDDWCISRQLVWGHQLPVYYNRKNGRVVVSEESLDPQLYERSSDVLDTWFSSSLWPFVCMNYQPGQENDSFPNSLLVTGSDIIFFWVARMMLMSVFYTNINPFKKVLITGIVRDHLGQKMSKSLNNGIDPNVLIDQYGVDALRMYLVTSTTPGEDLSYQEQKLQYNWNLLNKLWNSSRFVFQQVGDVETISGEFNKEDLTVFDQWILGRLHLTCQEVEKNFLNYNFTVVGKLIIDFFWDDFCNNYLEIAKIYLKNKFNADNVKKVLLYVLKYVLLLLNPFCPLITENIYAYLPQAKKNILLEDFVMPLKPEVSSLPNQIFGFVAWIRQLRTTWFMKPNERLEIYLSKEDFKRITQAHCSQIISELVNVDLSSYSSEEKPEKSACFFTHFGITYIKFDLPDEERRQQIEKRLEFCVAEFERATQLLENPGFVKHAPKEKIALERAKISKYEEEMDQLVKMLK